MGQAQLLLIVLGVVLVGIAIIAGIQAYDQNNRKASLDALTHDAVRMASDLQVWAQKPVQFGGPETYGDYASGTLTTIGYEETDGVFVNSNGECSLAEAVIVCTNPRLGTQITVTVSGLSDQDIVTSNPILEGATAGGTTT